MPVCRFYLQGNCRYGDRCYNEHPRHSSRPHRREDSYYEEQSRWGNRGDENRNTQRHGHEYQSPMSRWQDNSEDNSYRGPSHQTSSPNDQKERRQDRYHWSKESNFNNRFAALAEEKKPDEDVSVMLSTIQNDVKQWADSKMWPFSCYSYTKDSSCIDGLPDISPEEMRVLWSLHPSEYQNILGEVEGTYSRVKDELFEMTDAMKRNLISQKNVSNTNPSQNLKISFLYGPKFNFQSKSASAQTPTHLANPDAFKIDSKTNCQTSNASSIFLQGSVFGSTESKSPFATVGPTVTPSDVAVKAPTFVIDPQNISVFGSVRPQTSASASSSRYNEVYTPHDCLTEDEKKKFEAEKFTIGDIPTRPPSEQYCR